MDLYWMTAEGLIATNEGPAKLEGIFLKPIHATAKRNSPPIGIGKPFLQLTQTHPFFFTLPVVNS